jgi:hypothetical protein
VLISDALKPTNDDINSWNVLNSNTMPSSKQDNYFSKRGAAKAACVQKAGATPSVTLECGKNSCLLPVAALAYTFSATIAAG